MSRRFRVASMCCRLAVLFALAAGMGCLPDPNDAPAELPLKPCGVEERFFGDEVRLAYIHRAYDEAGNLVLSERDMDIDGTVNDRFVWQYALGGGLKLAQGSLSGGRMYELIAHYGDSDRLDSVTWTTSDGEEGRVDYEYDGIERIIAHRDRDNDGAAEEIATYAYDADGKLQRSTFGCTGEVGPRSITTMQWGEGGRIERVESRRDGDLGAVTQYSYTQDGLLERVERSYDDTVVYWETYEYDSRGNVTGTSAASVLVLGEVPPSWSVTNTVYDANGRILSSQNTINGDLFIERTYLYDCPDHEDSPGRHVGAPGSPLPFPPMGPRAPVAPDSIYAYAYGASSCG